MAADLLLDLLDNRRHEHDKSPGEYQHISDSTKLDYINHLAGLTSDALVSAEPQALAQSSHTLLLSLQAITKRSHQTIIDSASRHRDLSGAFRRFQLNTRDLEATIPQLDSEAVRFSDTFSKTGDNERLLGRKRALLQLHSVERLVDLLELPTLLSSAVSTTPPNHSAALDLNSHVRRLHTLYPKSPIVAVVSQQTDDAVLRLTADVLTTLKSPGLKLTTALRAVSWLRRVFPDLSATSGTSRDGQERAISLLFLRCRIATLNSTLGALQPLRELADAEREKQARLQSTQGWSGGQQTERFLKRYIEIFREQSFNIISMFRSIFSSPAGANLGHGSNRHDPLEGTPSLMSTFPISLIGMLLETLRIYLPAIGDSATRDSIFTQVLYCSGSLGRLDGDFGMLLAAVGSDDPRSGLIGAVESEWVGVVKRHRLLAGRLDSIIGDYRGTMKDT